MSAAERIAALIEGGGTSVEEFVNILVPEMPARSFVNGEPVTLSTDALKMHLVRDDLRELIAMAGAEQVVRDRIKRTKWASDARLLRVTADDIHRLIEPRS